MGAKDFSFSRFFLDFRQNYDYIKHDNRIINPKNCSKMEKTYKDPNGKIVSVVRDLSPQLETETVFHGQDRAEVVRLYLDGDRIAPAYGPERPCLRIQFAPDGKTISNIVLLNDPQGADFEWKR